MNSQQENLDKLSNALKDRNTVEDISQGAYYYIFLSFDLVNSTELKEKHNDWHVTIQRFYHLCNKELTDKLDRVKIWKYNGDEVIFYYMPMSVEDIIDFLKITNSTLASIIAALKNTFSKQKELISVKATVWSADVEQSDSNFDSDLDEEDSIRNLKISFSGLMEKPMVDFIGSDIDLGFRISKYSMREKVVVSAELVYFLWMVDFGNEDRTILTENFKIVSLEKLKGIWKGRYYPIIWYSEKWTDIENTFQYDDRQEYHIVNNILNGTAKDIKDLEKIFKQVNRGSQFPSWGQAFKNNKNYLEGDQFATLTDNARLSEIHCVAVVFNESNKCLLFQRSSTKNRLPDVWEFGCSQLERNRSFRQSMESGYREDFGIDIEIIGKLPFAEYQIPLDQGGCIPGLIFLARVKDSTQSIQLDAKKHQNYKWVDQEKIQRMTDSELVPDAKVTVKLALDILTPTT